MANEIQASISFRAAKGGATVSFQDGFRRNMDEDDMVQQTQLIGTSAEAIDIGDITGGLSYIVIKNIGTGTVQVGSDPTGATMPINVYPGTFCAFSPALDLYAIADTASRIMTIGVEV